MKALKHISRLLLVFLFSLLLVNCEKVDPKMEMLEDPNAELNPSALKATPEDVADEIDYLLGLIEDIEALLEDGLINRGNANALIVKIENAIKSLEKGNNSAADNQLGAAINQVEDFVETGVIPEEIGETLITKTENRDLLSEGSFIDPRDGQEYKVVLIGNQIWMAENLAYDGDWGIYAYENDESNVEFRGRLYSGYIAPGVCPPGWHLPTDDEWKELEQFIGMSPDELDQTGFRGTNEGEKLKSTTGWLYNGTGTDDYGFSAIPGGWADSRANFYNLEWECYFWATRSGQTGYGYYRSLLISRSGINRGQMYPGFHFSVRCIKDK